MLNSFHWVISLNQKKRCKKVQFFLEWMPKETIELLDTINILIPFKRYISNPLQIQLETYHKKR